MEREEGDVRGAWKGVSPSPSGSFPAPHRPSDPAGLRVPRFDLSSTLGGGDGDGADLGGRRQGRGCGSELMKVHTW